MKLSELIRFLALAFLFHLPAAPVLACEFDPPGMSHEQWLKWVDERNQKNDEKQALAKSKPEATPATGSKRPSVRGQGRRVSGDNVIRLRR